MNAAPPSRPPARAARAALLVLVLAAGPARADDNSCGNPFENHYGPFDYRVAA